MDVPNQLQLERLFAGIILSGSPYSVYDEDAPRVDPEVFSYGVPVMGICYGLQVRKEIADLKTRC